MKKMKQFVFYGKGNPDNVPQDVNEWTTNLLDKYGSVSHLGIQGSPRTVFYLNYGGDPISIGGTGVYELNLEGIGYITRLKFDSKTLLEHYDNHINKDHRLIVDILYEEG